MHRTLKLMLSAHKWQLISNSDQVLAVYPPQKPKDRFQVSFARGTGKEGGTPIPSACL